MFQVWITNHRFCANCWVSVSLFKKVRKSYDSLFKLLVYLMIYPLALSKPHNRTLPNISMLTYSFPSTFSRFKFLLSYRFFYQHWIFLQHILFCEIRHKGKDWLRFRTWQITSFHLILYIIFNTLQRLNLLSLVLKVTCTRNPVIDYIEVFSIPYVTFANSQYQINTIL